MQQSAPGISSSLTWTAFIWAGWALTLAMASLLVWLAFQHVQLSHHRDQSVALGASKLHAGVRDAHTRLREAWGDSAPLSKVARLEGARHSLESAREGLALYTQAVGLEGDEQLADILGLYQENVTSLQTRIWRTGRLTQEDMALFPVMVQDLGILYQALIAETLLDSGPQAIDGYVERLREQATLPPVRSHFDSTN